MEAQVGSESSTEASRLSKKINICCSLTSMVVHLSLNYHSSAWVKPLVLAEHYAVPATNRPRHTLRAFTSQQQEKMRACLNLNQMTLFSASSSDSSSNHSLASHSLTYKFSQELNWNTAGIWVNIHRWSQPQQKICSTPTSFCSCRSSSSCLSFNSFLSSSLSLYIYS